jgi:hypothetical protein
MLKYGGKIDVHVAIAALALGNDTVSSAYKCE